MGLDVYLYRYAGNYEQITKEEQAYEDAISRIYSRMKNDTSARRKAIAKLRKEHGYVSDGNPTYEIFRHKLVTRIEEKSKLHPGDDLFRVGYWRSSYNSGGINSVLAAMGIPGLYEITWGEGKEPKEYASQPDWKAVEERAKASARMVRDRIHEGKNLRADFVGNNPFVKDEQPIASPEQAMELAVKTLFPEGGRGEDAFTAWSTGLGSFWTEGLTILAAIPGEQYGSKGVWLISRDDEMEWYAKMLDIVAETAAYVLAQPYPHQFYLHWSS